MTRDRILITGAGGMLACAFLDLLRSSPHHVVALPRSSLDVTDESGVRRAIRDHKPTLVIQCAAYTRVDDAEREEANAFDVNAHGAANVAEACRDIGARFVYPSTDYVFDGSATAPYRPDAPAHPLNAYGRSKLEGECRALAANALVIRTSWLYGPGGRNFVQSVANRVTNGQRMRVVADQRGTPTWTYDLVGSILGLLRAGVPAGVWNVTNAGETTWYELAREVANGLGTDYTIEPCSTAEFPRAAARPRYSVLDCSATEAVVGKARDWREALREALERGAY